MSSTLRADALRNRERIVAAARRCFAEHGLEVGVDAIATEAGVGMGTLYRRFPTKTSLIHAIFEQRLDELQPVIDRALAAEEAWDGFAELLLAIVDQQAEDHGFAQMVVLQLGPEAIPEDVRRRVLAPLEELLAQAQAAGAARADVTAADVPAIVRMASAGVVGRDRPPDTGRHVGLLLDGLRSASKG